MTGLQLDEKARRAMHRQTRCAMVLPNDLAGKRVLDIGCRSGLGAFKIADRAGSSGYVVGTDASAAHIERACAQASSQHWAAEEWGRHLRFVCAPCSGLRAAGIEDSSFDVVVVNSVLYLEPSLEEALSEICAVLAPGGLLYHDAVLAEAPSEPGLADSCREQANVFGCAPTAVELENALASAGFCATAIGSLMPVDVSEGDMRDDLVGRTYMSAVVEAYRPRVASQGLVHLYCGDGKGKTTAAMGLALRALARGHKVAVVQFLKDGTSGEVDLLRRLGATVLSGEVTGFVFQMTDRERASAREVQDACLAEALGLGADLLVLDEACAAWNLDMVDRDLLRRAVFGRPEGCEAVLTGRDPAAWMRDVADYITEMRALRHPYDRGVEAREGVEF